MFGGDKKNSVYPRLRGGSFDCRVHDWRGAGLSPPTRGILRGRRHIRHNRRSIPAYAGDPTAGAICGSSIRVYPRLRGGSLPAISEVKTKDGLSPPTRGILCELRPDRLPAGSIPAYAGDPAPPSAARSRATVYPRLRGGSRSPLITKANTEGLSPPTRGIHRGEVFRPRVHRSIPAYAGDPPPLALW